MQVQVSEAYPSCIIIESEREIRDLKERVSQKEDRVAVLEQLAQAKTNTTALQHEIQFRDHYFSTLRQQLKHHELSAQQAKRQMKALQREIQAKEEENAELKQQLHQKEEHIRRKDEDKAELEEQLCQKGEQIQAKEADLEQLLHQKEEKIQVKDKNKAELEEQLCHKGEQIQEDKPNVEELLRQKEEQIQTKDRENAELKQQLHQKEEQIQAKDKQKVELEQQICQIKEHRPPEVTQVVEVQQEGSGHVTAHGAVPYVHQLLQEREVRKKEEELRQVKEDHQVEISRLIHETTAKQQEMELELKAQMSTKSEKINTLQSQVDALQHDQDDHQQQLKEKDIQIASISSESQYKQYRIETLTADRQELTRQVHTLEAKLEEEKFFRDHYSQEVDQLREELMEKIVENENLTKQQTDTLPTTCPASKQFVYSWDYFYESYVVSTIQPFRYSKLTNSFVPIHNNLVGCYSNIEFGFLMKGRS